LELLPYAKELEDRQQGNRFEGLDSGFEHVNYLCNGLGPELIVLAATPAAGKTTLCWQIACQVAEMNRVPVIFVSLEQSKWDLRAKALARLADVDSRHLLRGRLRSDDTWQWGPVLAAIDADACFARQITVIEGDQTTTVDKIRSVVAEKMQRAAAERALVVVDYLQNLPLALADGPLVKSTKDGVDLHVSALRQMARDLNVAVLCISSENRSGYDSKKMDVFKESGGIEYAADIAAILTTDEKAAPQDGSFRPVDINVVKNRNGERGVVKMRFYPDRAKFAEVGREAYKPEASRRSQPPKEAVEARRRRAYDPDRYHAVANPAKGEKWGEAPKTVGLPA
jgi:replicative DNA helicase